MTTNIKKTTIRPESRLLGNGLLNHPKQSVPHLLDLPCLQQARSAANGGSGRSGRWRQCHSWSPAAESSLDTDDDDIVDVNGDVNSHGHGGQHGSKAGGVDGYS
ncbi:hypothetical protein AJ78_06992, partial [Emergomyces pasteurianus Ep9510]